MWRKTTWLVFLNLFRVYVGWGHFRSVIRCLNNKRPTYIVGEGFLFGNFWWPFELLCSLALRTPLPVFLRFLFGDLPLARKFKLCCAAPQRGETQKLKNFLRSWIVHPSTRFYSNGRAERGKFPHPRIRSGRSSVTGTFVPGLPANFYDDNWLQGLTKLECSQIKMQPRINLELSSYIMQSVSFSIPSIIPSITIMNFLMTDTVLEFRKLCVVIM